MEAGNNGTDSPGIHPLFFSSNCFPFYEKQFDPVEQEESYTSKAPFLDNDLIPVYGEEVSVPVFSGRRAPRKHQGMGKESGFRGLYVTGEKIIVNSDLNGSANIGRKLFRSCSTVIRYPLLPICWLSGHPDYAGR